MRDGQSELRVITQKGALDKAAGQRERAPYIPHELGIVDWFVRGVRILRVVISTAVNIYLIQIIGNRIERMRGAGLAPPSPPSTTPIQEITLQQDSVITKVFGVLVSGAGLFSASPGGTVILKYAVTNVGTSADTYSISANSSVPWADFGKVPPSVTLGPSSSAQISVIVNVPLGPSMASNAEVVLT